MSKKKTFVIRSIIFDMDGVITNTMPDHYRAWHKALLENGINVSKLDIYSREGQRGIQSIRELMTVHKKKYTPLLAKHFLARKEDIFKEISLKRFIVGSRTFIKDLAQQGFMLALVTGTSRHELHRILPDKLYRLFSAVITGTDVKRGKPHPEPYIKALRKLKIKKSDAVVIENAPFGIDSAKKAGLSCLALETSLPCQYLKKADAVFRSFKDMRKNINFKLSC